MKRILLVLLILIVSLVACDSGSTPASTPTSLLPVGLPRTLVPDESGTPFAAPTHVLPSVLGQSPTFADTGNPPRVYLAGQAGNQRGNLGPFCWTKGCVDRYATKVPTPTLQVHLGEGLLISNSYGLVPTTAAINAYAFPSNPEKVGEYDGADYYFYARGTPLLHTALEVTPTLSYKVTLPAGDYILMFPTKWQVGSQSGAAMYAWHVRVQ